MSQLRTRIIHPLERSTRTPSQPRVLASPCQWPLCARDGHASLLTSWCTFGHPPFKSHVTLKWCKPRAVPPAILITTQRPFCAVGRIMTERGPRSPSFKSVTSGLPRPLHCWSCDVCPPYPPAVASLDCFCVSSSSPRQWYRKRVTTRSSASDVQPSCFAVGSASPFKYQGICLRCFELACPGERSCRFAVFSSANVRNSPSWHSNAREAL